MIIYTRTGYQVYSDKGKKMSKANLTEEQAQKRQEELMFFERMEKNKKGN